MSHKRMRTDDEPKASIDENEGQSSSTSSSRKPHDRLWFPEGNVVLGTSSYLFRVHKSMLSMHSSVFKDMFESPVVDESKSLPSADEESFDGLPLVNLLGDDDDHVVYLLRAIYERSFYSPETNNASAEVIVGLLLLSTKYDIPDIRNDVIKQLSRQYPTSLHELDNLPEDAPLRCRDWVESFAILRAVLKTGVTSMLTTIYYDCSAFNLSDILRSYPDHLDFQTLQTLLKGRQSLLNATLQILGNYVFCSEDCVRDHGRDLSWNEVTLREPEVHELFVENPDLTSMTGESLFSRWPDRVCKKCEEFVVSSIDEERRLIWSLLPSYFGQPGWSASHSDGRSE